MTAAFYHRWGIVPPVERATAHLPAFDCRAAVGRYEHRDTRAGITWTAMSKPSARLEIGKSSSAETPSRQLRLATPAVVALGRMHDRRSLRPFCVGEDQLWRTQAGV